MFFSAEIADIELDIYSFKIDNTIVTESVLFFIYKRKQVIKETQQTSTNTFRILGVCNRSSYKTAILMGVTSHKNPYIRKQSDKGTFLHHL